ncbi:MAG: hypothetical protein ABIG93_00970 [archaeon]
MVGLSLAEVILAVIIGTLAAIVYSLRVLIMLERRVAGMELNIQKLASKILKEETIIERAVKRKPAKLVKSKPKKSRKKPVKRKRK